MTQVKPGARERINIIILRAEEERKEIELLDCKYVNEGQKKRGGYPEKNETQKSTIILLAMKQISL